jgi:hypothetical protein
MSGKLPIDPGAWLRRSAQTFNSWRASARDDPRYPYGLIAIVSFLLAAGPPISLWPWVYWLPGMNFIRAPSRFTMLGILGLAILAGIGFERLAARRSAFGQRWLAVAVCALIVAEFNVAPLGSSQDLQPYQSEQPAIDRWLAGQPKPFVVAEIPLANPRHLNEWEGRQTIYMLHSTAHWQKTIHGYSGFRTELHERLYERMTMFPGGGSLEALADLGVTCVVVHTDLYAPNEWKETEAAMSRAGNWLRLEHIEGAGRMYSLHDPR